MRKRMSKQRRTGTKPELELRRRLHAAGLRYRVDYPVPGMPRRKIDIAFTRAKLAVMVDGCFWHGCPEHAVPPKHTADWWAAKLGGNQTRDRETDAALVGEGWQVLRLWEHLSPDHMMSEVLDLLGS